jgi:protease I
VVVLAAAGKALAVAPSNALAGRKAVFVIAPKGFRDEELKHPTAILKAKGCTVVVACSTLEVAKGMRGGKVKPDVLLKDVEADDYNAIVFVGGVGAKVYFDDKTCHALAKEGVEKGKVVAAICVAPSILARAGVLDGVPATAYRSQRRDLKKHGAKWSSRSVVRHGRIITANGPKAATRFGQHLAAALAEEDKP